MKHKQLEGYGKSAALPESIKLRIEDVLGEEDEYAADELVALSDEILSQLAALGIGAYLMQADQKEVYNDFLLQLFTSKSHAFNAGPLYEWAARMIQEPDTEAIKKLKPLFWENKDKGLQLNTQVHHLAVLRNEVMHGFFILPPERNQQEADNIAKVLEQLIALNIFELFNDDSFHFLSAEENRIGYSGSWGIKEDEWQLMEKAHDFGALSKIIRYQQSDKFDRDQLKNMQQHSTGALPEKELLDFVNTKQQGAFAIWQRPCEDSATAYANTVGYLLDSDAHLVYHITLDGTGISFTQEFVLSKLLQLMAKEQGVKEYSKDQLKAVKALRKTCALQPVLIVKDAHLCLFQENHLLHLSDILYDNNILIVACSDHFTWMDKFFNYSVQISQKPYIPEEKEWLPLLNNYLRYKGPNKEVPEEKEDYEQLLTITRQLLQEIKKDKKSTARRFADEHEYPMEYVHEVFAFLHTFLKTEKTSFEMDEPDELYGFPKKLTEASAIFLSIGRRDAALEYKHKILKT